MFSGGLSVIAPHVEHVLLDGQNRSTTTTVRPVPIPTAAPVAGPSRTMSSHRIEMCQRLAASRLTVTVDGSAPVGSGRGRACVLY
jgi:hypothetical protein